MRVYLEQTYFLAMCVCVRVPPLCVRVCASVRVCVCHASKFAKCLFHLSAQDAHFGE